ncbi:MAG: hypothetical protein EA426_00475, partial [Spirochaetaceae bacterium]
LPVASALEIEDIGRPWAGNYVLYKPRALAPVPGTMDDYSVFCALADRLGCGERFHENRDASEWIARFLDESEIPDLDAFKTSGIYIAPDQERVGLSAFASTPSTHPLSTPSGKVEIRSDSYAAETGGSAIPVWEDLTPDPDHPFLLVTPKTILRTHSQNGGRDPWPPVAAGTPRPDGQPEDATGTARRDTGELTINPDDARTLGVRSGDRVTVSNATGRLLARATVSVDIRPGVLCLHEGVWATRGPDGLETAGSANALTSTDGTFPGVAPIMHGIRVAVVKVESANNLGITR